MGKHAKKYEKHAKIEFTNIAKAALKSYCNCIKKLEKDTPISYSIHRFYLKHIVIVLDHCMHSTTVKSALKVQWELGHM